MVDVIDVPYRPTQWDEALLPDGSARPACAAALGHVLAVGPAAAGAAVDAAAADVTFAGRPFRIDPVPRVLEAAEWADVEVGLGQRVRALDRLVADVHGARAAVDAGVVPAAVLDTAEHLDRAVDGLRPPNDRWIGVAGLDVVRGSDGRLRVLEDNTRTPSGIAYVLQTRRVVLEALEVPEGERPRPVDGAIAMLRRALEAVTPEGVDGVAVLLSDGPHNTAWWEHRALATDLEVPLVTPDELRVDGDRLVHAEQGPVRAVYRRTDDATASGPVGRILLGPLRAGTLGVVNGPGTGIADDKLVHAHVDDLVRFFLGEEPRLPSVRTLDLLVDAAREEALDRIAELVIKPRGGAGGEGVFIGPHADPRDFDRICAAVRDHPGGYVAQELVQLSTHPTIIEGEMQPRHVDLRAFVFLGPGEEAHVLPGGMTRYAVAEGDLVVNTSQDGGAKDTWVLPS